MTQPIDITSIEQLGRLIRAQRKAQGLTQADLADASGVSLRFVGELERGRATAGVGLVLRILSMLGLKVRLAGFEGSTDG